MKLMFRYTCRFRGEAPIWELRTIADSDSPDTMLEIGSDAVLERWGTPVDGRIISGVSGKPDCEIMRWTGTDAYLEIEVKPVLEINGRYFELNEVKI